jgi:preprotein translocase subunit YajC
MTDMTAVRPALAGLLLIAAAPALAESAPAAFEFTQLLPMLVIFVLFYFMLIRPQMKRAKEHKQMVDGLQVGDEVVAGGGMLGRVTKVADAYVTIEVAKDTRIVVQRPSIQTVLPKGSIAAA